LAGHVAVLELWRVHASPTHGFIEGVRADTEGMSGCCEPGDCGDVFSERFARRVARNYRRRGLTPAAERIVRFVAANGVRGVSVLEVGGGVGEIQLELLRLGAARVTNLEISANYEDEAARLIEQAGVGDQVTRRLLDIAESPEQVEPADVVVLHRVVCCYPDYVKLLSAAGSHATRMLVFSHPGDGVLARAAVWFENSLRRLRGNSFRAYVHPEAAMVAVAEGQGFTTQYQQRSGTWHVVGFVR